VGTIDLYVAPMLAVPLEVGLPKHANQWAKVQGWRMEPKLDGIRCVLINGPEGVQAFTRTKHDITARLPVELIDAARELPLGTVLDGELGYLQTSVEFQHTLWPILDYNRTSRVTGSGPEVAQTKIRENAQEGHFLVFWAFDILRSWYDLCTDVKLYTRRELLEAWVDESPMIYVVDQRTGWDEWMYESYVAAGGEGVMLKNPDALYYPGVRTTQVWYKVKKFDTVDCIVTGFKPGQGKYDGQIGALLCRTPQGVEIACSGMTDEQRLDFTAWFAMTKKGMVGEHIEIRFFGNVGKTGKGIRHPQFVRARPDLNEEA
jgi:ATP-dependent DNA ligase